jgi:hypothetical protein
MKTQKKSAGISSDSRHMYSLTLAPPFVLPLEKFFKMSIEKLNPNPTNSSDQIKYNMFIQAYGTHYLSSIKIGAKYELVTLIDQNFASSHSQETVKEQINLSFSYEQVNIGLESGSVDITSQIMKEFSQNSERYGIFIPSLKNENVTKEWVEYAELNPGIIGLEAHYISDLLIANNYNEIGLHLKKTIDYFLSTQKYPEDTNMNVPIKALPVNNDLPWIPGLDKVGCGYDLTTLESKSCVFDLTESWDTWTYPIDKSKSYKVPKGFFASNNP